MDTITVTMNLPKDIILAANMSEATATTDIKKHLGLYLFKERILSFGKAAELSGMDKLAFMELAASKGISLNYNTDDYLEDLKTLQDLAV